MDADWEKAAEAMARNDPRYHALVRALAEGLYRGDFTAAEVLGALPLAQRWALAMKLRDWQREPSRYPWPPGG